LLICYKAILGGKSMFKKLIKNKKAQNTAEYAILISLVVAGIIAMQTYAQRALQGRVRDASQYMTNQTSGLGSTFQYEPYYLDTDYDITRNDEETRRLGNGLISMDTNSARVRGSGGRQVSTYNFTGAVNGV
jgi:Flp pilus assembly pilin Flp